MSSPPRPWRPHVSIYPPSTPGALHPIPPAGVPASIHTTEGAFRCGYCIDWESWRFGRDRLNRTSEHRGYTGVLCRIQVILRCVARWASERPGRPRGPERRYKGRPTDSAFHPPMSVLCLSRPPLYATSTEGEHPAQHAAPCNLLRTLAWLPEKIRARSARWPRFD